jgi:hypothetical protein
MRAHRPPNSQWREEPGTSGAGGPSRHAGHPTEGLSQRCDVRDVREVRDLRDLRDVRDLREVKDVRDLREVKDVRDVRVEGGPPYGPESVLHWTGSDTPVLDI